MTAHKKDAEIHPQQGGSKPEVAMLQTSLQFEMEGSIETRKHKMWQSRIQTSLDLQH